MRSVLFAQIILLCFSANAESLKGPIGFTPKIEAPDTLFFDGKANKTIAVRVEDSPTHKGKVKLMVKTTTKISNNQSIKWKSLGWKKARGIISGSLNSSWKTVAVSDGQDSVFSGVVRFHLTNFDDNMVAIPVEWKVTIE